MSSLNWRGARCYKTLRSSGALRYLLVPAVYKHFVPDGTRSHLQQHGFIPRFPRITLCFRCAIRSAFGKRWAANQIAAQMPGEKHPRF